MKGDHWAIAALIIIAGLLLEAVGAPIALWVVGTLAGWLSQIPDVAPNFGKLVGDLAWPLVALLFLFVFRDDLSRMIGSIKKFTWGDKIIDLSQELDRVEETVDQAGEGQTDIGIPLPDERFERLLEISPAAAILDAWSEIDVRVRMLAENAGYSSARKAPARRVFDWLLHQEHIKARTHHALVELSKVRNQAAHIHDVSRVDAYRFYDLAQAALRLIPDGL